MIVSTGYRADVFIKHLWRRDQKLVRLAAGYRDRFSGAPYRCCVQMARLEMTADYLRENMEGMSLLARRFMSLPDARR